MNTELITFNIYLYVWGIILVASLVGNIARSGLTRLKYKWTGKWKGKGVDITHRRVFHDFSSWTKL